MIRITQKFKPFSQQCGIKVLVPGSCYAVEAFPTLTRLYDLRGLEPLLVREERHEVEGPLKEFMVVCDIERGCVSIRRGRDWQHAQGGGAREKERLFLGVHKKQQWEGVQKRLDFSEIFPFWHALGRDLELDDVEVEGRGMFSLLPLEGKLEQFKKLFLAGFEGIFVPRLKDNHYQGIAQEEGGAYSPLYLLKKSAGVIRSLFIEVGIQKISLLPDVPREFHAGKFVDVKTPFGLLDMEWTKHSLRRVRFRSEVSNDLVFGCPGLSTMRVSVQRGEKGVRVRCQEPLTVEKGIAYYLDRFES